MRLKEKKGRRCRSIYMGIRVGNRSVIPCIK